MLKSSSHKARLAQCRRVVTVMPVNPLLFKPSPDLTTLLFILILTFTVAIPVGFAADTESSSAVSEICKRIGNKLGSVSTRQCLESKLQDTGARSINGQAIIMKEYPPTPAQDPVARVLLIGGTHGDEYSSVSIVFKWLRTLDRHHSGLFHWHVAPLINPDGLLQRHSQRLNANGIDLNRNMPTPQWQEKTKQYWQRTGFDPRRYPGTAPLSEPESRWLYEEIRQFKPHVIVSVHAPFGVLDFDGPPLGPSTLGQLHLKLIGTYPGSLGNCAGVQHEIPVITVELPHAGIMPSKEQISRMWVDLIRWMRANIPKDKTVQAHASFEQISRTLLQHPDHSPKRQAQPVSTASSEESAEKKPVNTAEPHSHIQIHKDIGS